MTSMFSAQQSRYLSRCLTLLIMMILGGLLAPHASLAQESAPLLSGELSVEPQELQPGQAARLTLALSVAGSQECVTGSTQPVDVALVIDVSSSMGSEGKLTAAQEAAMRFVDLIDPETDRVAVVAFSDEAYIAQDLTNDIEAISEAIAGLRPMYTTDIEQGLQMGETVLNRAPDAGARARHMLLLSDGRGDGTADLAVAERIRDGGIELFTISLGDDADRTIMRQMVGDSSRYHHAPSAGDLQAIYEAIGGQIVSSALPREVVVELAYDNTRAVLVPGTQAPPDEVAGDRLIWRFPALGEGETVLLETELRPTESGTYDVLRSASISYVTCGDAPVEVTPEGDTMLTVVAPETPTPVPVIAPTPAPASPCETEPIGDACLAASICGIPTMPCSVIPGLPRWVCLLLLPLFLLGIGFWWILRNRRRRVPMDVGPAGVVYPPLPVSTHRPAPSLPSGLAIVATRRPAPPIPALIIGLGSEGVGALAHLRTTLAEAYGDVPDTMRLLGITRNEPSVVAVHADTLVIHVENPGSRTAEPRNDSDQAVDRSPADGAGLIAGQGSRNACRQALVADERAITDRLIALLRELRPPGGRSVELFIIASMEDPCGSGLLVDVAHLARLSATEHKIGLSAQALLLLPGQSFADGLSADANFRKREAFACWRELDRFHLVFGDPYPINYPATATIRQGRLFERCYLIGAERDDGPSFRGVPLQDWLFPAATDFVISSLDPGAHTELEEVFRTVNARAAERQTLRHSALYSSLGVTSYLLPTEDLVRQATLDVVDRVLTHQTAKPTAGKDQLVDDFFTESTADGRPAGTLARLFAQPADWDRILTTDDPRTLGRLLIPGKEYEAAWSDLEPTVSGNRYAGYPLTSLEAGRSEPAYTTDTFLPGVEEALDLIPLLAVSPQKKTGSPFLDFLPAAGRVQAIEYQTRLSEKLDKLLNSTTAGGNMAAVELLSALDERLGRLMAFLETQVREREKQANLTDVELTSEMERLHELVANRRERLSTNQRLLVGIGLPALFVVLLGIGSTIVPALSPITQMPGLLAPLFAVIAVIGGSGWTYYSLLDGTSVTRRQETVRRLLEQRTPTAASFYLTTGILDTAREMQAETIRIRRAFDSWHAGLSAQKKAIAHERNALQDRRDNRARIRVRHYVEYDEIEHRLQRLLGQNIGDEALRRVRWLNLDDGAWQVAVTGTKTWRLDPTDTAQLSAALNDLGVALSSRIRSIEISDVLPELITATTLGDSASLESTPFILTERSRQPDLEEHRFVVVKTGAQTAYFDTVLQTLRQTAATHNSRQLLDKVEHPYRCTVMATFDLIHTAGLPVRQQGRDVYYGPRLEDRHIFEAERHASQWEQAQSKLGLPRALFSPFTCLPLEFDQRTLAFWWAFAVGWVQEQPHTDRDEGGGAIVLRAPGHPPRILAGRTAHAEPSLWRALVNYALGANEGDAALLRRAVRDHLRDAYSTAEDALDHLDRTAKRIVSSAGSLAHGDPSWLADELERQRRIATEDLSRRLYGELPLLPIED